MFYVSVEACVHAKEYAYNYYIINKPNKVRISKIGNNDTRSVQRRMKRYKF